jgi:hypothetical protein
MDSRITCCFYENLTFMLSTYLWCSCKVLPTKAAYIYVYDNKTRRLQTYVLMSWIRIDFYGSRLRSRSFLCVSFHASLFVHALWVFTSKISQTSLGIHPKPKTSFCDHLLVHNPIWVWSKILDGDSNIPQDHGIYTYFSSHFPPLFYARGWASFKHGGGVISDKCYVSIMLQKLWGGKEKH